MDYRHSSNTYIRMLRLMGIHLWCMHRHAPFIDTIFKNLSIIYKRVNTTESFVHPSLHLFSHPDPAIHIICFLLITSIFEDLFVPERMFAGVVINMFQLLVGLSYHFMMLFAFNTPSQNDITIHQSNHFSEKEQLSNTRWFQKI